MSKQLLVQAQTTYESGSRPRQHWAHPDTIKTIGEILLLAGLLWGTVVVLKALIAALAQVAAFVFLIAAFGAALR